MAISESYHVGRSKTESQALDDQHYASVANAGYLVHPTVACKLSKVADLGTGTGIFLIHLAEHLPSTAELVGYDVSNKQFATKENRPANVDLRVQSILDEFPNLEFGTYDLVHLRYLVIAISGLGGWKRTLDNAISLLKPGGYIQWLDTDVPNFRIYQSKPGQSREGCLAILEGVREYCATKSRGYGVGGKRLRQLCEEAGMEDIQEDVFTLDRTLETRDYFSKRLARAWCALIGNWITDSGSSTSWTVEKLEKTTAQVEKELADGVYVQVDQICVIARKA